MEIFEAAKKQETRKESIMKTSIMKRMIGCAMTVILVISLSAGILAQASSPVVNEEKLLEATDPILTAYKEHYVLQNVRVTNPSEVFEENASLYVTFFLTFDATLKYDSAVDLPRVKGIAQALNIDGDLQSVQEFSQELHAADVTKVIGTDVQSELQTNQAIKAFESAEAKEAAASTSEKKEPVLSNKEKVSLVSDYVLDEVDTFVTNLQDEYIGTSSEFNIDLRATIDGQGNVLKLEYGLFDGYSDDITTVIPASNESMIQAGEKQVSETVDMALEKVAQNASFSAITPASNTNFIYYRTKARDYANTYTSNPSSHYCSTHGWNICQDSTKYNKWYFYFCCTDCANYVSQAMYAGGVPTDGSWKADKGCYNWVNCQGMRSYFRDTKKYWTTTTYRNCNAGGVILLIKSSGRPSHAMMNVLNDSVTTKYSAHTNDRKNLVYTHSGLLKDSGASRIEYYIFDRVSPAH